MLGVVIGVDKFVIFKSQGVVFICMHGFDFLFIMRRKVRPDDQRAQLMDSIEDVF